MVDLRGCPKTGNKGLCELLIYKLSLKRQLFQREAPLRATDLLINTDVPFAKWLESEIEPRVKSHKAWMHEEASGNLTWRAGRSPSEIRWLSFVEESVFGTRWDAQIKLMVKAGTLPLDALTQHGLLAEELSSIDLWMTRWACVWTPSKRMAPATNGLSAWAFCRLKSGRLSNQHFREPGGTLRPTLSY